MYPQQSKADKLTHVDPRCFHVNTSWTGVARTRLYDAYTIALSCERRDSKNQGIN